LLKLWNLPLLQPSSSSFKGKFAAQANEKSHGKRKVAKKPKHPGKIVTTTAVAAITTRGGDHS